VSCCAIGFGNANATVGYRCAYGANRVSPGCYESMEFGRRQCTAAFGPPPGGMVRCVRGG
jgi:hypothetical protein